MDTQSPRRRPPPPRPIFIREAARLLNRRMGTLRKWDQEGILPEPLRPKRGNGGSNWRYWTESQIEGIREWMRDTDRRSGRGFPHYNPTKDEVDMVIEKLRRPHGTSKRRVSEIDLG